LLDAGRTVVADREQVSLALEESRVQAAQHQEELEDARTAFWETLGGAADEPPVFDLAPDSVPVAGSPPDAASDEAVRAVPELRILDLRRRMEEASLAAARAERLPTLSMRGGYFHYGTKRFDSFESEVAVGVDVHVPVFSGFKTSHAIEGASMALEAARLRYDAVQERLRLADLALQAQRGGLSEALAARTEADRASRAATDAYCDRMLLWANLEREAGVLSTTLVGARASSAPP